MTVQEVKLRRGYDLAVRRWKQSMRQDGYTLSAWQAVYESGQRLKAFLADRRNNDCKR